MNEKLRIKIERIEINDLYWLEIVYFFSMFLREGKPNKLIQLVEKYFIWNIIGYVLTVSRIAACSE